MKHIVNYGDGPKAIYEVLKQQIIVGDLKAGEELKIMPLAKEMDISIVPLREAIRMLAAEKLVELRPRRSPIIARIDVNDLIEINQIRSALEPIVLADAILRHTPETLAECEAIVEQTNSATDPWEMVEFNKQFHLALLGPSRLKRSMDIIVDQYDGIARLSQFKVVNHENLIEKLNTEHRAILEAAKAQDIGQAVKLMTSHIDSATDRAKSELEQDEEDNDASTTAASPSI